MTQSRTTYYRRRPGLGWLAGAVAVPLLIAGVGFGVSESRGAQDTTVATSAPAEPINVGPLTVSFGDDGITANGVLTTEDAKQRLVDSLQTAAGDVNVVANVGVDPQVTAAVTGLDFTDAGPVFEAGRQLPKFGFVVDGSSIALRGTAISEADSQAVQDAVAAVWPGLTVVNQIDIDETATATTPEATPATPAPENPATPAPEDPATPAPADENCANTLATELLTTLTGTPPYFGVGETTVNPEFEQALIPLAGKLAACPSVRLTVIGHTDNTGDEAGNQALSESRAQAVADVLIANGVAAERLEVVGQGATTPIADNNTEDGRQKNRRVMIRLS